MSGFFAIRDLPQYYARIYTDEDNEISFSFEGVRCVIDAADGSFTIRVDTSMRIYMSSMSIVRTGFIDKYGKYLFNKKNKWAADNKHYAEQSDGDVTYYSNAQYFENNIERNIRQRKVYIRV
jgi:hypothetical protein